MHPILPYATTRKREGQERYTLFHMGLFSVVWRADSFGSITIKFGTVVGVDDVIIQAKFRFNFGFIHTDLTV